MTGILIKETIWKQRRTLTEGRSCEDPGMMLPINQGNPEAIRSEVSRTETFAFFSHNLRKESILPRP